MTQDDLRLDEQAIIKEAEVGLSRQLGEAEKIDVDVKTDLLKAVERQGDSVAIGGQGLFMQKDI